MESAFRDSVVVANISSSSRSPAVMFIVQNFLRYLLNLATLILFLTVLKISFPKNARIKKKSHSQLIVKPRMDAISSFILNNR